MSGYYRFVPVTPWARYPELGEPAKPTPLQTDHIPALRGLIALARGNYATVSPEDLTAAVDAGYVHPDVLACVADEIAHATETSEDDDDTENGPEDDEADVHFGTYVPVFTDAEREHVKAALEAYRWRHVTVAEMKTREANRVSALAKLDTHIYVKGIQVPEGWEIQALDLGGTP